MPLYFFDTHDGECFLQDTEGTDMVDAEEARLQAQLTLVLMIRNKIPDGDQRTFYVNVNDGAGMPIYTVCMSMVGRWLGQAAR